MAGTRTMQIGAFALVAGVALTLLSYSLRSRIGVVAFSVVMLGGAVQVIHGLVQRHRDRLLQAPTAHRSATDIDILIRAMVAVAAFDSNLEPGEISMIEDVSAGLLGDKIPRSRIERVLKQTKGKNPIDQIARIARQATPEGAELAVKGAVWAGRADGELSDAEQKVIAAIAAALGVSGHRLRHCIAEADHAYDRLAAHDAKGGQR
jgi:tellurite resistance protein